MTPIQIILLTIGVVAFYLIVDRLIKKYFEKRRKNYWYGRDVVVDDRGVNKIIKGYWLKNKLTGKKIPIKNAR